MQTNSIQNNLYGELVVSTISMVPSDSRRNVNHVIEINENGIWSCSCEAFKYSRNGTNPGDHCKGDKKPCRHITAKRAEYEAL